MNNAKKFNHNNNAANTNHESGGIDTRAIIPLHAQHIPLKERLQHIKVCVCQKCKARFEPLPHQSQKECLQCTPAPLECIHAVSLLTACPHCMKMNTSKFIRQMPQVPKKKPKKQITQMRLKSGAYRRY